MESAETILAMLKEAGGLRAQQGEVAPAWPSAPQTFASGRPADTYDALRDGFEHAGANLVDSRFGWNIGMHAAAQGNVETLRMLLTVRGWAGTGGDGRSGWDPREHVRIPLTEET